MKKVYQIPEVEVMQMESTELLEMSLYDTEVTGDKTLSRDVEMFFDEED